MTTTGPKVELLGQRCVAHHVEIWAYFLMPDHIPLIALPQSADAIRWAIGEVHRSYSRMICFPEGRDGNLWQGQFASFVLDAPHLLSAARAIEFNPVRAGLIEARSQYRLSSAAAQLCRRDDTMVRVAPLLKLVPTGPVRALPSR